MVSQKPESNELSNMRQLLLNTGKLVRHESRWYWPQS